MKKLIFILLVLFVISCDTNVITKYNTTYDTTEGRLGSNYVVRGIKDFGKKSFCEYKLTTGRDYLGYNDEIYIIDSIGKFNVCDTVYVTVVKK